MPKLWRATLTRKVDATMAYSNYFRLDEMLKHSFRTRATRLNLDQALLATPLLHSLDAQTRYCGLNASGRGYSHPVCCSLCSVPNGHIML